MKCEKGFTLAEMMAVVVILAILASMAIPSYLDYIVRSQVESALPLTDLAKRAIATYWDGTKELPADNEAAALPVADKIVGNYVSAVGVDNGVINISFGNRANSVIAGKTLSLRPAVVEDAPMVPITWVCGFAEAPEKMTVQGNNATNVDPKYLPMSCRSLKGH